MALLSLRVPGELGAVQELVAQLADQPVPERAGQARRAAAQVGSKIHKEDVQDEVAIGTIPAIIAININSLPAVVSKARAR